MKYLDFIWPILLFFLSIVMIVNPKFLWKVEHFFSVKNGEPTDLYIAFIRIGGIFFMFITVIISVKCFL